MNISLKYDKNYIQKFKDFISGKTIGKFEINEENLLKADLWLGGIKFRTSDDFSKIELKSIPRYDALVDIRFVDGFEISEVPVKVYGHPEKIEIHCELKNGLIIIQLESAEMSETKVTFTHKHKDNCRNIKEELELFTFMKNLGKGMLFTIFTKNGKSFSKSLPFLDPIIKQSELYIDYFQKLKEIENYFNVRFSNIDIHSITESTYNEVMFLTSIIKGESLIYDCDGDAQFEIHENTEEILNELIKINKNETPVVLYQQFEEEFELHGQKMNLGYKNIEIIEPLVYNIELFKSKVDNVIKVKSNCKKIKISYSEKNIP